MGKELKQIELSKAIGIGRNRINTDISRGKLEKNSDGKIDIENPKNKIWIENKKAEGCVFDLNKIYDKPILIEKKPPPIKKRRSKEEKKADIEILNSKVEKQSSLSELAGIEVEKKKADLLKVHKSIYLDELKIKKLEGELIPAGAVKNVFLFAAETFRNTFSQETDGLIDIYLGQLNADHELYVEIKKELNEAVMEIYKTAKSQLLDGLKGVIDEYQEVRGRGERR